MAELILINPAKPLKGKKMATRKRARTAAQKRATAKLIAFNKSRRSGRTSVKRRKSNPARAVSAPAAAPAPRRRRTNPTVSVAKRSRRRRNPTGGASGIMPMLNAALMGAVGATAVGAAMNYLPLPAALKTGYIRPVTQAALALSLGIFGRKFLGRNAVKMAEGALTVTLTETIKQVGSQAGIQLGYYSPGMMMNEYVQPALPMPAPRPEYRNTSYDGMSEYVSEYLS